MKFRVFLTSVVFGLSACGGGGLPPPHSFVSASPSLVQMVVPCSQIQDLRALGPRLTTVTNSKTGDTMEYVIIGDGAVSSDVLVMFPGTGQILTGWPVQMLTNSSYSPNIKNSITYDPLEDAPVSLCHDYRIALFDYPGVGIAPLNGPVTRDMMASDIDTMMNDAATKFGIPTTTVDPVGWSLGTANALKYAVIGSNSNPARTVHNVILIAAGPGGSEQGRVGGDTAPCILSMLDALKTASGSFEDQLKATSTEMIFPYAGQSATDSGTASGCTATTANNTLTLSVTPDCGVLNHCIGYLASSILDLETYPWSLTKGIDTAYYDQERELSNDFDVAYCSGAANFTSTGCTAYGTVQMSAVNGGVCKTDTSNPDVPAATSCAPIKLTGAITVINGYEDLFTQWTYGKALLDAYAQSGIHTVLDTYPGAAGHGVMVQHPAWTQVQMAAAMQ